MLNLLAAFKIIDLCISVLNLTIKALKRLLAKPSSLVTQPCLISPDCRGFFHFSARWVGSTRPVSAHPEMLRAGSLTLCWGPAPAPARIRPASSPSEQAWTSPPRCNSPSFKGCQRNKLTLRLLKRAPAEDLWKQPRTTDINELHFADKECERERERGGIYSGVLLCSACTDLWSTLLSRATLVLVPKHTRGGLGVAVPRGTHGCTGTGWPESCRGLRGAGGGPATPSTAVPLPTARVCRVCARLRRLGEGGPVAKPISQAPKTTARAHPEVPVPSAAARRAPSAAGLRAKSALHHFSAAETFI